VLPDGELSESPAFLKPPDEALRMRDLAQDAAQQGGGTPCAFRVLFIAWVVLGVPVFLAFVAIFWLMVAKPSP